MKFPYLRVATALIVSTSLGILPKISLAQDTPSPNSVRPATTALPNSVYEIVYAASSPSQSTETVVSIGNPSTTTTCQVQVEWDIGVGGTPVGYSGPFNLGPQTTLEFTTAKPGTTIKPFILNVFRDTTTTFEGKARIRTNCSAFSKFAVNAVLVTGSSYLPIKVIKPSGNTGD